MALADELHLLGGAVELPRYFPMGYGDGPVVMTHLDTAEDLFERIGYYAWQPHGGDPVADAPRTDERGGVVYFDGDVPRDRLDVLFDLLGASGDFRSYAAELTEATTPVDEGFARQLRLLTSSGLRSVEGGDSVVVEDQPLGMREALHRFVAEEQARWGTYMGEGMTGMFGGDGDSALEKLCFGFMVENQYWGVMRIWSRAALITK